MISSRSVSIVADITTIFKSGDGGLNFERPSQSNVPVKMTLMKFVKNQDGDSVNCGSPTICRRKIPSVTKRILVFGRRHYRAGSGNPLLPLDRRSFLCHPGSQHSRWQSARLKTMIWPFPANP